MFRVPFHIKLVYVFAVISLGIGFCISPWGKALDRFVYDYYFVSRGPLEPPQNIVIVAIDEPSFDAIGKQWPWPRSLHAMLLDELYQAGAKIVILDIIFAEPSEQMEDAALAAAIKNHPATVLACDIHITDDRAYSQENIIVPFPDLVSTSTPIGFTNLPVDSDGFLRRAKQIDSGLFSLPLSIVRQLNSQGGDRKTDYIGFTSEQSEISINFAGPPRTIQTVSYYQALQPSQYLPEGFFRDKIVFVGLSIDSAFESKSSKVDHYPVPFSRGGKGYMAGIEILANITANLLNNNAIKTFPLAYVIIATVVISIIFGIIFLLLRPMFGALLLLLSVALAAVISFMLFARYSLYTPLVFPVTPLVLCYLSSSFIRYWETWKEKNFIRKTFSTYMSPDVVNRLISNPELLKLGGETAEATILFLDLADFTTFSEKITPSQLIDLLNRNLGEFSEIVFKWEGMIDKFIGDALMAVWGTPILRENHALLACSAACEMKIMIEELAKKEKLLTGVDLRARIGINSGSVVAGNVGGAKRFDYTVLGNEVNLASRLEGVNKIYRTDIIMSENTASLVGRHFELRELDLVLVKGKDAPIKIYELQGVKGSLDNRQMEVCRLFALGRDLYYRKRWIEAREYFTEGLGLNPDDGPCQVYVERCLAYEKNPPSPDWNCIFVMDTK